MAWDCTRRYASSRRHAVLHQVEQQLSAEDQAVRALEVGPHALGIDEHRLDQVGGLVQQIVDQRGRIGQDHALRRRVRDVALVPQGNVFKSRLRVAAHHARQSADLLGGHGIALVRHGRRTLLLFAEELLGLAHFGALQVANLGRDLVQASRRSRPASPDKCA